MGVTPALQPRRGTPQPTDAEQDQQIRRRTRQFIEPAAQARDRCGSIAAQMSSIRVSEAMLSIMQSQEFVP